MNTSFLQPKNALQRADELCSVGQEGEAFELLQRTILDRKFRYLQWDALAQQDVVMRFLSLAVNLDRIKQCRDGLLNYRNHCQHGMSMLGPIEKVVLHFRGCAEDRVARAEQLTTPSKQQQLDLAIRVCMDTYRTIIDVIRSTPKLGKIYHSSVVKAHELCKQYGLRGDFRRLADLVRSNYSAIMKQKPKTNDSTVDPQLLADIEDLKRPEIHIETKLSQLKTAVALESWKEAQLSIDELFQLGILDLATFRPVRKGTAPAAAAIVQKKQETLLNCIAQYFQYSADYFLRCDFLKLHALSLYRYLMQIRSRLNDQAQLRQLSSITVLAILAVPNEIATTLRSDGLPAASFVRTPFDEEERRLAGLIGYGHLPPQRHELIQLVLDKKILEATYPSVRALFENVTAEAISDPYEILKMENQVGAELSANQPGEMASQLADYDKGIKICVLKKTLQSISQIYESLSISRFQEQYCPSEFLDWRIAEREIASSSGGCIKFDFERNAILLNPKHTALDSRWRLISLSLNLSRAILDNDKSAEKTELEARKKHIRKLMAQGPTLVGVEEGGIEGSSTCSRLELIEKKREKVATLKRLLHEAREDAERERVKKLADQEEQKIICVKKELEEGRKARELQIAKLQLAKITVEKIDQLIKQIGEESKSFKKSNLAEIQNLDPQKLLNSKLTSKRFTEIVRKIISDKHDEKKLEARIQYKRHDHLARALRATKVDRVRNEILPALRTRAESLKKQSEEERLNLRGVLHQRNEVIKEYKDIILQFF